MSGKSDEKSGPEYRAKIFWSGRSQAIRLPKELRFNEDQKEVKIRREGNRIVVEPGDEWPEDFLASLGSCPEFPDPPERTPVRSARDRFGR